jgi:hypothetical protein
MIDIGKAHLKNLNALRKATKLIDRELNLSIRGKNEFKEQIYLRLLLLLWMTWAECKLNTLLTVLPQVSDDDRKYVDKNAKSEAGRWLLLLELFFRRRYLGDNQKKPLDRLTLGHTAFTRYSTIRDMIERIGIYIEIRNRLAHGQWHIALNSNLSAENPQITQSIWRITKTDILVLKRHLIVLGAIMNDLISSKNAFESGFDQYLKQLDKAIKQFEGRMDEFREFLLSKPYYRPIAWDKIQSDTE